MAPRYKLQLKRLDYVSLVDDPAQPNAKCLLIKRRGGKDELEATARLVKTNDELGLAFFWAFTSTNKDGTDHFDLQGDQVVADDAMIKAAMSFMENGGAVDEMHDEDPDGGRVVFAMPMTPQIASAFGVATKTSGLMIAIKPSADAMAKLKDGTYRAVSIAGLGERVAVKSASRVVKAALYTDEVDGHQHEVCVYEDGGMYVRYAVATGADTEHNHGLVFENGTVTILANSGHTHQLAEGQPGIAVVPADAIVIVQASVSSTKNATAADVRARNSTPHKPTSTVKAHQENIAMPTEQDKQIADLTKRNERLERIAKMTGAHKAYFDTLTADDADAFLAKSNTDRESVVKTALDADKPIWTGEVTKVAVRTRDGELALQLAKQNEANAVALAKRDEVIEKAEVRTLAKSHLGNLAGADEVHDLIVRSLRKSGAPQADIDKALEAMKGWNTLGKGRERAAGVGGEADPTPVDQDGALAALEKGLLAFAKAQSITKNVWTAGLAAFVKTPEGAALKSAYDESTAG